MIRILHVVSSLKTGGGVQQLLLNYFTHIDRNQIKFDFIVHGDEIGGLEQIMHKFGSKVFHVTPKKISLIKNLNEINTIIKEGNYDIVHCHQDYSNVSTLLLAKINSVPIRISHAHSNFESKKIMRKIRNGMLKLFNNYFSNYKFACSRDAGRWLHGHNWIPNGTTSVIMKNAINIKKFAFNEGARESYRNEIGVSEKFVLLHVGRFSLEKNHEFLIDIMYELEKRSNQFVLLLVGNGPLEKKVKQEAIKRKISESIIFLGARDDVASLMSTADIFLLPSLHEGFGITAIEAQVSGLKTFVSDSLTEEINISNIIKYLSISDPSDWVDSILKEAKKPSRHNSYFLDTDKYSIKSQSLEYEKWVLEVHSKNQR